MVAPRFNVLYWSARKHRSLVVKFSDAEDTVSLAEIRAEAHKLAPDTVVDDDETQVWYKANRSCEVIQEWLSQNVGHDCSPFDEISHADIQQGRATTRPVDLLIVGRQLVTEIIEAALPEPDRKRRKMVQEREEEATWVREKMPSPSEHVKSASQLTEVFTKPRPKFYCGRPMGNYGPSVSLFNRVLGLVAYWANHLDDDDILTKDLFLSLRQEARQEMQQVEHEPWELYAQTFDLVNVMLNAYRSEAAREQALKPLLTNILGNSISIQWHQVLSGCKPDFIVGGADPYVHGELKVESGLGGDALLQASLDFVSTAASNTPVTKRRRARSNLPGLVVSFSADLVEFGLVVSTDGVYMQRVFLHRNHMDVHRNRNIKRMAHMLHVFRTAIKELEMFYRLLDQGSPQGQDVAFLYPSPCPVPDHTLSEPEQRLLRTLTFTGRMDRAGRTFAQTDGEEQRQSHIYVATNCSPWTGDELVVKFTSRYCARAHKLLADNGLAPKLHACIPVCDSSPLFMVVMDRVRGEMLSTDQLNPQVELWEMVYADVKGAIILLHQDGLVFGDLRPSNIMVPQLPGEGGNSSTKRAMLIDFDWAGEEDKVRYPVCMNTANYDVQSGMVPNGWIRQTHDLVMLERLRSSLWRAHAIRRAHLLDARAGVEARAAASAVA